MPLIKRIQRRVVWPMRLCFYLLVVLSVTGCFATGPRPSTPAPPHPVVLWDSGPVNPAETVDRATLEALADPVPRAERRSDSGNYTPYVVLGQTYEVMPTGEGYVAEGLASWYGSKFHGHSTSNGEIYDMFTLTAAHKTLPIPCYVRVENLRNGRSTIVRVNDRGPFHDDRLMDLSYAAAVKLGFDLQGTAPVRLTVLGAATGSPVARTALATTARSAPLPGAGPGIVVRPVSAPSVTSGTTPGTTGKSDGAALALNSPASNAFYLQAGAFKSRDAAERLRTSILRAIGSNAQVAFAEGNDAVHRVRVGPLSDLGEASRLQNKLMEANLGVALIVRN